MKNKTKEIVKENTGVTLIELLVIMAILAMIIGLAFPVYQSTVQHSEYQYIMEQFEDDFFYARQVAISESSTVQFLFLTSGRYTVSYHHLGNTTTFINRYLPEGLTVRTDLTGNRLRINRNGNIVGGGSVRFEYHLEEQRRTQRYIFRVATGRFRVETS